MEIYYFNSKQKKLFESSMKLQAKYGADVANKLYAKLQELLSVENLEIYARKDSRCEALHGNYKGKFSVRITGNLRLIFEPYESNDEPLLWKDITAIRIFDIHDYH